VTRKRLLILSRYSRMGASSRLRTMQYLPYLVTAGFEVEVASFFDDDYLDALYSGRRVKGGSLKYFMRRILQLRAATKADVIWLEKEALPWVPWRIEKWLLPKNVPVVSDYDDALFHRYDTHRNAVVRKVLGRKIDGVMAGSTIVFAGNDYLARRAHEAGAQHIELVPTVVDMQAYHQSPVDKLDKRVRVGWIGTPKTWAEHCIPMLNMLRETMLHHDAVFRAIGSGTPKQQIPGFEFPDWSEDEEVGLIQGMDIGIMPLTDSPMSRGKCGYKLIQYMACGLPVIASPIGVNSTIVEHGVNGYLASNEAEWKSALSDLLSNPALRRSMGEAGRKKAVAEYSIQAYGPKVANLFSTI